MADTPTISTPIKAGAAGVAVGGLAVIGYQFRRDSQVLLILLIGVVCVVLLLLAYRWLLGQRERARSLSMGEEIKAGGRRKPREINSPQALAKIADLQGKFEEGVEKFRAAGKNLYSLPWYLLVGEPGSGKTEAVRHCNVGFPPGLQEEQQGVGGTVNMNWWFTNYAVILDTAGRLVFDGIEAGSTAEWREFLKLLQKARPNCPINGLLLVIPADSLIVDTADKIDSKAGKIAQQLDTIQRTLGVRFPVFVVVTKSDRINGFREFFDSMDDPRLQHQMLGWSNPNALDAPFDPEQVEQHLHDVAERLGRRRRGLLLDPVHTDDPNGRRLDQVDALYAFPESLVDIGPRLRRYLERIFSVGEWSPKPLFLRGIYFTSSMREGSALDKDLAELLGVPVESLPEGRVWEQDRAFFLRDLFMAKVFREKGLVTRAGNTRQVTRRRKLAVLGSGFAAVIVLTALTVVGSRTLDRNVGAQAAYWAALRDSYAAPAPAGASNNLALIAAAPGSPPTFLYRGAELVRFGDEKLPLRQVLTEAQAQVNAPIDVPAAFLWTKLGPTFEKRERHDAYRLMFESSVIQPVIDAVRRKMETAAPLDGADNTGATRTADALKQLLQLERLHAGQASQPLLLAPLVRYLLDDPQQYGEYEKDQGWLQEACDGLFPAQRWSFELVDAGTDSSAAPIERGVDRLAAYWAVQFGDDTNAQRVTVKLLQNLRKFRQADVKLAQQFPPAGSAMELFQRRTAWKESRTSLDAAAAAADQNVQQISSTTQSWSNPTSLEALYDDDRTAAAQRVWLQLRTVRDAIPAAPGNALAAIANRLSQESQQLQSTGEASPANVSLKNDLAALDAAYFKPATPGGPLRYELFDHAYDAVGNLIATMDDAPALTGDALAKLEAGASQVTAARKSASDCGADLPADASAQRSACQQVAEQVGVASLVGRVVQEASGFDSAQNLMALAAKADPQAAAAPPPAMPMTAAPSAEELAAYRPAIAGRLLAAWSTLRPAGSTASGDAYAPQDQAVAGYAAAYVHFWTGLLNPGASVRPLAWSRLAASLPADNAAAALQALAKAVDDALAVVENSGASASAAVGAARRQAKAAANIPDDQQQSMTSMAQNWHALAVKPPPAARDALLAQGAAAVAQNDLVENAGDAYQAYWQAVTRAALLSLASEPGSMLSDFARFPLAPPVDGVAPLDASAIARANVTLASMSASGAQTAGSSDPELAAAWRKIVFGDAASDPAQLQRLGQIRAIAAALASNPNQPPLCRVSIVDLPRQQEAVRHSGLVLAPASLRVTFCDEAGQRLRPLNLPPVSVVSDSPAVNDLVSYPLTTDDAMVAQFDDGRTVRLPGPYPCLRGLYDPAAQRDSADGSLWLVPLHLDQTTVVFVRFKLDTPLAALPR